MEMKLGVVETQFAELIWAREPIASGELVKLCEKELNWKKSTTYTVLKKLCERGIFQNNDGIVTSLLTKDEFNAVQSEQFVEDRFTSYQIRFLFSTRELYIKRTSLPSKSTNLPIICGRI